MPIKSLSLGILCLWAVLMFVSFAFPTAQPSITIPETSAYEPGLPFIPPQPAPPKQPEPALIVKALPPRKCHESCTCPDCPNCVAPSEAKVAQVSAPQNFQVVRQCGPNGCQEIRVPAQAMPVQGSYGQSACGPSGCGRSGFFRGRRGR